LAGRALTRIRPALERVTDPVFLAAVLAPAAAALLTLFIVVPTLQPGVANWDTAEFQTVGPVMGTAHPTGYPSYIVLGWLASIVFLPFGEPAFRMNLLQAFLAAGAAAGAAGIVQVLTGRRWIALATALLMIVMPFESSVHVSLPVASATSSPVFMRLATHADPHMFHVALVALIFVLLLVWDRRLGSDDPLTVAHADRWLVAAAVVYGIAVTNHSLALLLPPAILLFVILTDWGVFLRWRTLAACGIGFVGAVLVFWLEMPIRAAMGAPLVYGHPDTWSGFWYVVLAQQFGGSLVDPLGNLGTKASAVLDLMGGWMGGLAPLAALGFGTSLVQRPRYLVLSGLAALATAVFAASYANADIERYYLVPILVAFTWAGLGLADLADGLAFVVGLLIDRSRPLPAAAPDMDQPAAASEPERGGPQVRPAGKLVAYGGILFAIEIAIAGGLSLAAANVVSVRQQPTGFAGGVSEVYAVNDAEWMQHVLASPDLGGLPENSVIESTWSVSTVLWYGQKAEGLRPDIIVIDDSTRKNDHIGPNGEVWDVFDKYLGSRPVFTDRFYGGCDGIATLSKAFDITTTDWTGIYRVNSRLNPRVELSACDPVK
jgi:hypothetical protein